MAPRIITRKTPMLPFLWLLCGKIKNLLSKGFKQQILLLVKEIGPALHLKRRRRGKESEPLALDHGGARTNRMDSEYIQLRFYAIAFGQ